ncbi:DUF4175 family protein [Mucilaginibacter myungsuensis]|uniref:DUF4175 family protein n=1 Tax=Mucilaginibacter myungsuensis TaxID=649104 RepID=A0A929PW74_9SPHI|nr:DUF4175 family protein [Mucilaginibacter myungsuensis]MBE9662538.1 hypothetical protein [Mucilaginibacter myungsuensis]MDN3597957.1 hypothetical protein [Mucilaginibacter myungsuensis]
MIEHTGIHKIKSLRRNWILARTAAAVLLGIATALLILLINFVIYGRHLFAPLLPVMILVMSLACFLMMFKPWKLSLATVLSFLDRQYPALEESTGLMFRNPEEMTLLQRLQIDKIGPELSRISSWHKAFLRELWIALAVLIAVVCAIKLADKVVVVKTVTGDNILRPVKDIKPEKVLPEISSLKLTIHPPAYTGKASYSQDKFTIRVEEGSTVSWSIKTNIEVSKLTLIFNDKELINLKPDADWKSWTGSRAINKPGFYQIAIDGKLSDLYQIETIKDAPPVIHIKTPKQYTYIDAGEKPLINLIAALNDDYGLSSALIHATVAKGSGEGVKFKDYSIPFGASGRSSQLQHIFDLPKLNMEPGDELYFYIEAKDNHQQKSRTEVYAVNIQDTAALLSMDGIVNGSDVKPEYFRSQRQIIMDTEKLLRDKDTMSRERFNTTSGNIGADQKLLRLRYGRFLGEEDESDVGGPPENDELSKPENFSNGKMILDAMTDKHDNAEDAGYLDPSTKVALKATLNEMWRAELHLRMYKPQDALPFEYKALRLLKDLQQKSRAYVAKTTYKPTPLKMEKRLSGDLSKVEQPSDHQILKPAIDQYADLKQAVQILEQVKLNGSYAITDKHILQLAKQQLSARAAAQPGIYLKAISAMNRILSTTKPTLADVELVENAIQKVLPKVPVTPQSNSNSPDMGLSKTYYQNLKRNR